MKIMKLDFGVDDECPGQGLDSGEAIKRAKSRRPIIEPIGDFRWNPQKQDCRALQMVDSFPWSDL